MRCILRSLALRVRPRRLDPVFEQGLRDAHAAPPLLNASHPEIPIFIPLVMDSLYPPTSSHMAPADQRADRDRIVLVHDRLGIERRQNRTLHSQARNGGCACTQSRSPGASAVPQGTSP